MTDAPSRTVGVEEEFLLVSDDASHLVAAGDRVAALARELTGDDNAAEHELKQQQVEIGSAPCLSLAELHTQLVHRRRVLAGAAAGVDARVVALATCPVPERTTTTPQRRYRELMERFGPVTSSEQLTCGQHVHVSVQSDDEAVAVIDRLQLWLPTLRALAANSPFWREQDTAYASYRSVLWDRWPTSGATHPFGSIKAYRRTVERLVDSGAALDERAVYFDARVSTSYPTVEIRVADVSIDVGRAVAVAALCRALVEQSALCWRDRQPVPVIRPEFLRAASWAAARSGLSDRLTSLPDAEPIQAFDAVQRLVDFATPALQRYGDVDLVEAELERLRTQGTGADVQRARVADGADMRALTAWASERTTA